MYFESKSLTVGEAAKALGRIGDRRAVEPLIALLTHKNGGVRGDAAEALGTIGDERAVRPLISLLADPWVSTREKAVEALTRLTGKRPTVAALIRQPFGWIRGLFCRD